MIEHEQEGLITGTLARMLGSKTGLCTDLHYRLLEREVPSGGHVVSGEKADLGRMAAQPNAGSMRAMGKGSTPSQSAVSYLGELVERYQVLAAEPALETASYECLAAEHDMIDPKWLHFYSQTERERLIDCGYGLDAFDKTATRRWIRGQNLLTGDDTYLPVELVLWQSALREQDYPIVPPTTNGLACHETQHQALLCSLYEVIERHAFVETWFTRSVPRQLHVDGMPTENERVVCHLLEYETELEVPIIGCLAHRTEREKPYACFCGGAASTYRSAIEGSLTEVTQLWSWMGTDPTIKTVDPDAITDLEDNLYYYMDPDNANQLEFLLQGPEESLKFDDERSGPENELEWLLDQLAAADVTPIAFDITMPEITETGLTITRVVVPEFLPLVLPSFPPDAHPRLAGRIDTTAPHPYP
ncbi:YcaO-like family protein [Natrinema salsiterrestre]|uniref:YcaO-like family protein n=1 Tax=Natrinema salsiterrestre TaxID=2950540 RepID=A0A9Q4L4J8_9EURY|nr:YcaO-like family protein [Natrinema salsiterrestre]MDF9747474.1 YcaO-like family protein [Natrinema salsiterrestre]